MELKNSYQRVAALIDRVPAARDNYKLLILLYWQIFDEIEIPQKVLEEIAEKGTEPETINRAKRKVIECNTSIDQLREEIEEAFDIVEGNNCS